MQKAVENLNFAVFDFENELQNVWQGGRYRLVRLRETLNINHKLENTTQFDFINYIDLSSIDKEKGIIENIKCIKNNFPSRARQKVYKNDLLISTLSGSIKSIAFVERDTENLIASTGFFAIRKTTKHLLKFFLMFLLRTKIFQDLLIRKASGAIMPSISENDFLALKIPLPPLAIQEQIVNEINNRRERAKKLQQEAKEILESAKKQVESIILGG